MSQWDQFDSQNDSGQQDASEGGFAPESSADIYDTPDVAIETAAEEISVEEIPAQAVSVEDVPPEETPAQEAEESALMPCESGQPAQNEGQAASYAGQYGNGSYNSQYPGPYGSACGSAGAGQEHDPYGGQPYNSGNPYGGGQPYNNGNPYGGGQPYNNGNPYGGGQPYNNGNPYDGQSYNNGNPYDGGQSYNNGNPYGSGQPYNNGNPYGGGQPYNNGNPYSAGNPYDKAGAGQDHDPYGGQPGGNGNAYSPYAAPPRKNKNGLIIGLVVTVVVLLLIAVIALVCKLASAALLQNRRGYDDREEYNFDDDGWGVHRDDGDSGEGDDPFDDGGRGDEDADSYDDDGDGYYELHDELRWDLSYVVDFEEYYEGDDEDGDAQEDGREIYITYPVIAGDNVPNLDSLNQTILDEVDFLKSVADDAEEGTDVYLSGEAYVTYMDEEKLSIVFKEDLYLEEENGGQIIDYYLYSLNIDMEKGVVLDNRSIINTDDDFSVDFRQRSDRQNGELDYLTSLSDQEITSYFESDDIIVFYTPLGMEIGFNYEYGWVTVTYRDYEKYLRVF